MPIYQLRPEFDVLLREVLLIVGALFPIVNPMGSAPIFLTLTRDLSSATRTMLSGRIAMNGFILLIVSLFIGTHILAFFGISLPVIQVGGGMVVIATGWSLLTHAADEETIHKRKTSTADASNRAFYPLTLPLTVGPGSISVAITLGANRPQGRAISVPALAGACIGAALIAISIYLSYRFAERIARALGETAMNVILRLSSFILVCIGVQIVWNGVSALLRSVLAARIPPL
ncbi:MAG: multiple antibiotic resistance protein [Bryobacterales bacterium]|jgi:multiple antibiotic resistance protein|nr:multiple antibiotic resistance protein [Bryobacterales bacterium]